MNSHLANATQNDDHFDVAIILLNYGHVEKTLACLDSLKLITGPSYQIFVVDNASPDDSLLHLRERLDKQNSTHTRALREELEAHEGIPLTLDPVPTDTLIRNLSRETAGESPAKGGGDSLPIYGDSSSYHPE